MGNLQVHSLSLSSFFPLSYCVAQLELYKINPTLDVDANV